MLTQTSKVGDNKVPLAFINFSILAKCLRYSVFFIFCRPLQKVSSPNSEKRYISASEPKIEKNKGTLFSQTLKVEENKVPLVF